MKHILVPAGVLLLLTSGCTTPASYVAAHPELPANIANSIRQGDVVAGMTRDQVQLVWGSPERKSVWDGGDSWSYKRPANRGAGGSAGGPGMPPVPSTMQQDQEPADIFPVGGVKPQKMVYFRGDRVVLVEKAAGEL